MTNILEVGVRHLVDPRLSADEDDVTNQLSRGMNALVLKVACTGAIRRGHILCAIVDNLLLCVPETTRPHSLPPECAMPLSRLLLKLLREEKARGPGAAFRMPNVDSMRAISVLHSFFSSHPATPPADDTPYCSAKTFLAQLMEALGPEEVVRIADILKIPQTSFLNRLVNRLSGGVAGAAIGTNKLNGGATEQRDKRRDIHTRILSIIDRITVVSGYGCNNKCRFWRYTVTQVMDCVLCMMFFHCSHETRSCPFVSSTHCSR